MNKAVLFPKDELNDGLEAGARPIVSSRGLGLNIPAMVPRLLRHGR